MFRDFAGSTVVHTVGGFIALAGCIVLGPRLGRVFKRDGGGPLPPHDLTWGAIGGVILWFGWYGFNPGSTLSAMDWEGIGRVAANTTLAACAGGMIAVFFVYPRSKKWDLGISVNGFLGGLVAITCPVLLGLAVGRDPHRCGGRDRGPARDRLHGVAALGRPDRRRGGPRLLRHLGHAQPRPARHRAVRHPHGDGTDTTTVVKGLFYGGGTGPAAGPVHRQRRPA